LGLILVTYGGLWAFTGLMTKRGLEAWVAQQRAEGIDVAHGPASLGGFPLAVNVTISDVTAQATPERGGWTWSSPLVRLEVAPWNPSNLRVLFHLAPQNLALPQTGQPLRLSGQAERAELTVRLDLHGGPPKAVGLIVNNAVVESPSWPKQPAALTDLALDFAPVESGFFGSAPEETSYTLSGTLTGLHLPPALRGPLAPDITSAQVDAIIVGEVPMDRPLEEAMRTWSNADGRVQVNRLSVNWAPLALETAGSLSLDTALQPEGTMNARVSGFMATIDGLQTQGMMRGRDATMAKVLLGTMARPGPNGDPQLEIPVVVRDSAVWAGPVALLPLPRMPWGPPAGSLGAAGLRPGLSIDRDGNVVPNQ